MHVERAFDSILSLNEQRLVYDAVATSVRDFVVAAPEVWDDATLSNAATLIGELHRATEPLAAGAGSFEEAFGVSRGATLDPRSGVLPNWVAGHAASLLDGGQSSDAVLGALESLDESVAARLAKADRELAVAERIEVTGAIQEVAAHRAGIDVELGFNLDDLHVDDAATAELVAATRAGVDDMQELERAWYRADELLRRDAAPLTFDGATELRTVALQLRELEPRVSAHLDRLRALVPDHDPYGHLGAGAVTTPADLAQRLDDIDTIEQLADAARAAGGRFTPAPTVRRRTEQLVSAWHSEHSRVANGMINNRTRPHWQARSFAAAAEARLARSEVADATIDVGPAPVKLTGAPAELRRELWRLQGELHTAVGEMNRPADTPSARESIQRTWSLLQARRQVLDRVDDADLRSRAESELATKPEIALEQLAHTKAALRMVREAVPELPPSHRESSLKWRSTPQVPRKPYESEFLRRLEQRETDAVKAYIETVPVAEHHARAEEAGRRAADLVDIGTPLDATRSAMTSSNRVREVLERLRQHGERHWSQDTPSTVVPVADMVELRSVVTRHEAMLARIASRSTDSAAMPLEREAFERIVALDPPSTDEEWNLARTVEGASDPRTWLPTRYSSRSAEAIAGLRDLDRIDAGLADLHARLSNLARQDERMAVVTRALRGEHPDGGSAF